MISFAIRSAQDNQHNACNLERYSSLNPEQCHEYYKPRVFAPGKVTFHFNSIESLPGDFSFAGNLIYFSFVTLTTMGYGDIVPLHPYAVVLLIWKPSSGSCIRLLSWLDL